MREDSQTIGPYRLLEVLGRGGMGVVYRAAHAETGELAAVKTLSVSSEGLLAGIRREIHALAGIRHPGVVRILDQGVENGLPWYAMELLSGVTLRRFARFAPPNPGLDPTLSGLETTLSADAVASGPADAHAKRRAPRFGSQALGTSAPSLHPILTLVRRLCAPLAFLHGEGVVHRDLKPDNILVQPDWMPILVDFGLVSHFGGSLGREALELATRGAGTVAYIAPEQLRGELLDARADLYSLGCILYELVTGRPPFLGKAADVLHAHLHAAPVPASDLVGGIPAQLDELMLRLLAKDPRDRLGYASDVAAALERLGADDGLAALGPTPRPYLYRPSLSGREEALRQLEAPLARLEAGKGSLVLVTGESGVGKTRLALEVVRTAQVRGMYVLMGECSPPSGPGTSAQSGSNSSLQALRKPLQIIADRCRSRGRTETDRLLGRRGKVLAQYEPALAQLPGQERYPEPAELSAEAAQLRLFESLTQTFEALAESAPLLLVLDDLQWADELLLAFGEYVLRGVEIGRFAVLVLATCRMEDAGEPLRKLADLPALQKVELGRLDAPAVSGMVGDMLALSPAPELFSRFLARHSEGNPFFVAEYLSTAIAAGALYRDNGGRWQVAQPSEARATEAIYETLSLPGSLRELILRRLDTLSLRARQVAEVASVLGRQVDEALLASLTRMQGASLMDSIAELILRQVLEDTGLERMRFVHDKIREVVYAQVSAPLRRELHRAAAESLEAELGGDPSERDAVLGHHWEQALVPDKARDCYLRGARRATARYSQVEAERLFLGYLALVPVPTSESVGARNELGLVLRTQGRSAESMKQHRLALDESRALGEHAAEAKSLLRLGQIHRNISQLDEALRCYALALEIVGESADAATEGHILCSMALANAEQHRFAEADLYYDQSLRKLRESGQRRTEAIALQNLALMRAEQGRQTEAFGLFEEALQIQRLIDDRPGQGSTLLNLAVLCRDQGRTEESLAISEQALAIQREVGDLWHEAVTLGNIGFLHAEQGRPAAAREFYEQSLTLHRTVHNPRFQGITLHFRASLERRTGDSAAARRLLEEAESFLRGVGTRMWLAVCTCERGHLALAEAQSARPHLSEACDVADSLHAGAGTELRQATSRLRRAVEAFESGRPMFGGECVEDIPEGLRRWLRESGQLAEGSV